MAAAVLLVAMQSNAQEHKWTLTECIDHAIENNIRVKQSGISVQSSEVDLSTAKGRRLPGVSASASENLSFGRGLTADNTYTNSNTTSTSFSLGADVPIFRGLEISKSIKQSELNLAAATKDLEKAKDDIRVAVAQAYVQILYSREILDVATRQAEHDKVLLEQMEHKREQGMASMAEVAAQRATLAQATLSVTQAQNNLNIALLDLTQLLELTEPEGFDIVTPSVDNLEMKLLMRPEEIYARAVEFKPQVLSAEIKLESAKVGIDRAKSGYYPTLSLSGGVGSNYYTNSKSVMPVASFGDQIKNNFSQYVGLNLNIPIFSRLATRNQVRSAKLNAINMQLQLDNVKKDLYKEIQQAYYNAVASQTKYASCSETQASSKMYYELTEEKYTNGKANISEYNDAKNSYLSAESDYLKARYECLFQTKLLDFYRGEALAF